MSFPKQERISGDDDDIVMLDIKPADWIDHPRRGRTATPAPVPRRHRWGMVTLDTKRHCMQLKEPLVEIIAHYPELLGKLGGWIVKIDKLMSDSAGSLDDLRELLTEMHGMQGVPAEVTKVIHSALADIQTAEPAGPWKDAFNALACVVLDAYSETGFQNNELASLWTKAQQLQMRQVSRVDLQDFYNDACRVVSKTDRGSLWVALGGLTKVFGDTVTS